MIQKLISRPILSSVIAVLIVIVGVISLSDLPIAQYPNITTPVINVSTNYPGADAEVAQKAGAIFLEQAINGVADMLDVASTCRNAGSVSFNVYFN